MFNEKYAHGKKFNVDADKFEFIELKDLIENVKKGHCTVKVLGLFTYEAKYGVRPVIIISEGYKVNLPDHCLADVQSIMKDQEDIDAINAGHCGFKTSEYTDGKGVKRYSGSFIDI